MFMFEGICFYVCMSTIFQFLPFFPIKIIVLVNNLHGNENVYPMNVPFYTHLCVLPYSALPFVLTDLPQELKMNSI